MRSSLFLALVAVAGCSAADLEPLDPLEEDSAANTGDGGVDARAREDAGLPDGRADGGDGAARATPWASLAAGITARETGLVSAGASPDVVVVYGGWGASSAHVQGLADALFEAALAARRVGWLVAVKGPDDARYVSRNDIGNSVLSAELTGRRSGKTYGGITLIAHSSGAYVAEELIAQLAPTAGTLAKVRYFNLDGGARDLAPHRSSLGFLRFVYAKDGSLLSRNASSMQSAASAAGLTPFVVDATGSGCTAADSLHDAVVIARPWSPTTFDVARDYTQFSATRPVVTSYLAP